MNNLKPNENNKKFAEFLALDLEGKTRGEVLMDIANFAKNKALVNDARISYEKFLDRESRGTTAIGGGIAFPEACWIEMSRPYAFIICRTKYPVNFNALDKKPVRIVVAFLGRDKNDLSRLMPIARLVKALKLKGFREAFLNAKNENEAFQALTRYAF